MAEKYYQDNSMVINGVDVSLPYDEYVVNFRKKYPRAQPMTKYNYELAQKNAKRDARAIGATKEELDLMLQDGQISKTAYDKQIAALKTPEVQKAMEEGTKKADETVWDSSNRDIDDTRAIGATKEELDLMLQDGLISKDAYDKNIAALNTPEVQEEMARGEKKADENVWDSSNRDIDDTRAIGATKEELDYMLQNGLISKAAYEKQIAALKTPEVQKAMEEGTKKADEYISELSDSDDDDDGGGEGDPDKNYKKSMMSIWDAYRAGLIDKETAGYFTIDAIATLAKNLGRSIGNVGAQFSGGTIDNGHDESKWGQRQNALINEEIGKETESLGGAAGRKAESESLDNEAKRIRNAYTPKQLEQQIEMFKKELEMADINLDMAHSRTDLINFIKKDPDYANNPFKMGMVAYLTQNGVGSAVNNASSTLLDAMNWIVTLVK